MSLEDAEVAVRQMRVAYGKLEITKEPKTEASRRTIPLAPQAVTALRRHSARQAEEKLVAGAAYADRGLVFVDEIGDPIPPGRLTKTFARLVREAGLPRITLHGLGHSWATIGLHAGVDVLYVAKVLGHSSPGDHPSDLPAHPFGAHRGGRRAYRGGHLRLSGHTMGTQTVTHRFAKSR